MGEELRIRHGNGTLGKWLLKLVKTYVLLLDDWGMAGIDSQTRTDLLEIVVDRTSDKATIITRHIPINQWHAWFGDATIADRHAGPLDAAPSSFHPDGRVSALSRSNRSARKPKTDRS